MSTTGKKLIVISGVNLYSGGTLTILRECLHFLEHSESIQKQYSVFALVHKKELFPAYRNIELQAYPKPRGSWLHKLYYEYIFFNRISKKMKVHLWFSLYDMSPTVQAERRAVYCHNPSPFYKANLREMRFDKGFALFTLFYKYLYAINIKRNGYVVVQQDWIRQQFIRMFHLAANRVIVAHPDIPSLVASVNQSPKTIFRFVYPALPRVFKNMEVIVEAAAQLREQTDTPFEIVLTIDGTENPYARYIRTMAAGIPEIKLVGLQTHTGMAKLYQSASCLLFPSKLETWGLPITEAKQYRLPMLISDLPYARETVGDYEAVSFFMPENAQALSDLMMHVLHNNLTFDGNRAQKPVQPLSESWQQTFDLLLQ